MPSVRSNRKAYHQLGRCFHGWAELIFACCIGCGNRVKVILVGVHIFQYKFIHVLECAYRHKIFGLCRVGSPVNGVCDPLLYFLSRAFRSSFKLNPIAIGRRQRNY